MTNSKYAPSILWILLIAVVIMVVGLDVGSVVIFAIDAAMVGGAGLVFKPEISKKMKDESGKELRKHESPLNWLFISTRYFAISFFASLASLVVEIANVGIEGTPSVGWLMFVFAVIFCAMGFVFIIRIWEFLRMPSSKANILFGKIFYWFMEGGIRISFIGLVALFQVFNAIMLSIILQSAFVHNIILPPITVLYGFTLILSFVGMVPVTWSVLLHLREQIRHRDWFFIVSFISPWILLIIIAFLAIVGIQLT